MCLGINCGVLSSSGVCFIECEYKCCVLSVEPVLLHISLFDFSVEDGLLLYAVAALQFTNSAVFHKLNLFLKQHN